MGFGGGEVAVQDQQLGQVSRSTAVRASSSQAWFPGEGAGWEPAEAGVLASAEAVFDVGVGAVAAFQVLDPPWPGGVSVACFAAEAEAPGAGALAHTFREVSPASRRSNGGRTGKPMR